MTPRRLATICATATLAFVPACGDDDEAPNPALPDDVQQQLEEGQQQLEEGQQQLEEQGEQLEDLNPAPPEEESGEESE